MKDFIPMWLRYRLMDLRGRGIYSAYADRNQCIFIHIPKTAGTSIARALFHQVSRHMPWYEYKNANAGKFRKYFKFAFVRNPWDRLVSTYFFLKKGGMNELDRKWAADNIDRYRGFEEFVQDWLTESNIWSWVHFKPQYYFICDAQLNLQMDFIGRYENLESDFETVAARLHLQSTLQPAYPGQHRHYTSYYNHRTCDIVSRVYQKDIELFNYKYPGNGP